MSATSVRGSSFFTFSRNSRPDMWGMTMSLRIMCADCSSSSAKADSLLSASRQTKPSASFTVQHSFRMVCSSSTINSRILRSSFSVLFTEPSKSFRDHINELLHPERLLHAGRPRFPQRCYRLLIGDVPSNEDQPVRQVRSVFCDPGMHLAPIYAPGSPHIRHDPLKRPGLQQPQGIDPRLAAHYRIPAALQGSLDISHHRRLVLNEQHGLRFRSCRAHVCLTPALAPTDAACGAAGNRTMNVAPPRSMLL